MFLLLPLLVMSSLLLTISVSNYAEQTHYDCRHHTMLWRGLTATHIHVHTVHMDPDCAYGSRLCDGYGTIKSQTVDNYELRLYIYLCAAKYDIVAKNLLALDVHLYWREFLQHSGRTKVLAEELCNGAGRARVLVCHDPSAHPLENNPARKRASERDRLHEALLLKRIRGPAKDCRWNQRMLDLGGWPAAAMTSICLSANFPVRLEVNVITIHDCEVQASAIIEGIRGRIVVDILRTRLTLVMMDEAEKRGRDEKQGKSQQQIAADVQITLHRTFVRLGNKIQQILACNANADTEEQGASGAIAALVSCIEHNDRHEPCLRPTYVVTANTGCTATELCSEGTAIEFSSGHNGANGAERA